MLFIRLTHFLRFKTAFFKIFREKPPNFSPESGKNAGDRNVNCKFLWNDWHIRSTLLAYEHSN